MVKKENGNKVFSFSTAANSHAPDNVSIGQQIKWGTKILPETQIAKVSIG